MSKEFTITFCGDTSLGYYYLNKDKNKYPEAYQRLQSDPMSFFSGVAPLLEGSNEIIVNLETVLSTNPGNPIEGKQYPGCDDPVTTVRVLKELGVTAVMLANNHAMDFGEQKLLEMIDFLHTNGIATIGAGRNIAEARKPYTITLPETGKKIYIINGMRSSRRYIEYGFFATKDKPGIANTRFASVKRQIEKIKSADPESTIVVCPHWQGIDYKDVDETKKQWCRDIVDAGADLIVGHGTHKKNIIEEYSGRRIYFSIGNFVFNAPGRYQKMLADPFSAVVSAAFDEKNTSFIKLNDYVICTDNKSNKFYSSPIGTRGSEESFEEISGVKVSEIMPSILGEGNYKIYGNKESLLSGVDIAVNNYAPGVFFVLRDDGWPDGVANRQEEWGLKKTIRKAKNSGYVNYIIPSSINDNDNLFIGLNCVVSIENTWSFFLSSAKYLKEKSQCKIVAVTGSSGKTTTCKMLEKALDADSGNKVFTAGKENRNLFRNTVSSMSRLTGYDVAIFEVAASRAYLDRNLLISPNVAIFTSLSEAHLAHYNDLEGLAKVKSDLFREMPEEGHAIINADMPYSTLVVEMAKIHGVSNIITYGENSASDIVLKKYKSSGGIAEVSFWGESIELVFNNLSRHLVFNAIAVILAAMVLGYDWREVAKRLASFTPLEGRGAIFNSECLGKKITVVDDSYNSNIASLQAGLDTITNLVPEGNGRRIAIIGDMLDLGESSIKIHERLGRLVSESSVDKVVLVGEDVVEAWKEIPKEKKLALFSSYLGVFEFLKSQIIAGDIVYFKASNGVGLGNVVACFETENN